MAIDQSDAPQSCGVLVRHKMAIVLYATRWQSTIQMPHNLVAYMYATRCGDPSRDRAQLREGTDGVTARYIYLAAYILSWHLIGQYRSRDPFPGCAPLNTIDASAPLISQKRQQEH